MQFQINLSGLHRSALLGWTQEERSQIQPVSFDIAVKLAHAPLACQSDDLKDTVCYAHLSEIIDSCLRGQSYKTIERLGFRVFQQLKTGLPAGALLSVKVTKLHPPIADLTGGASFLYSEWDEGPSNR